MLETPPLASRYTEIVLRIAADRGVDAEALLGDQARPFPPRRGRRTWDNHALGVASSNLKRLLDDEFFGLLEANAVPIGTVRFACELAALSASLGDALRRVFILFSLITREVRFDLVEAGDTAAITMSFARHDQPHADFLAEWWLWLWHFLAQWFVGSEIDRAEVEFPHRLIGSRADYELAFGPNCRFERGAARVSFARSALDRRVVRTLADVEALHRKVAIALRTPEVEKSWRTIVKTILAAELGKAADLPTMAELASARGLCAQTLRRRLAAEGVTYRKVKAEVRAEAARRVIASESAKWSEVAARAGFAEVNGLSRSIRNSTGLTLTEFRRSLADQG